MRFCFQYITHGQHQVVRQIQPGTVDHVIPPQWRPGHEEPGESRYIDLVMHPVPFQGRDDHGKYGLTVKVNGAGEVGRHAVKIGIVGACQYRPGYFS